MRVVHKGLLIVAVPLVLELLVLLFSGILLIETDKAHHTEAKNRILSETAFRLLNTELNALLMVLKTWQNRDTDEKIGIEKLYFKTSELQSVMTVTEPDSKKASKAKKVFLQTSIDTMKDLKYVGDLADEGFTLMNFMKLEQIQRDTLGGMSEISSRFLQLHAELNKQLKLAQDRMKLLERLQLTGSVITFIMTGAVAVILIYYYKRTFVKPILTIRSNIESYSENRPISPRLRSSDEIGQFDEAFHQMIAQLKQSSEREQSLFENSSDMIGILNRDLTFQKINFALTRITGYSRDEVINKSVKTLFTDNAYEKLESLARAQSFECELQTKSSSGQPINMVWSFAWIETLGEWCFIARDVSEEKKVARLKEEFLKLIANDLQHPLESISEEYQQLSLGTYGDLPEQAVSRVRTAIRTLNRMVSLVGELLQLERLNGETESPNKQEHLVKGLLETATHDLSALAQQKRVHISVECDSSLHCHVDADKIIRVLVNFLSNAIKFSNAEQTIEIKAYSIKKESVATIRFEVVDHGPGMNEESAAKLFKAYAQLDAKHGKRGEGTGLGLVISQRLVEQHGGIIGVKSTLGKGSIFWFELPVLNSTESIAPGSAHSLTTLTLQGKDVANTISSPDENNSEDATAPANRKKDNKVITNVQSESGSFSANLSLWKKAGVLIGIPITFQIIFSIAMLGYGIQASSELEKQLREHSLVNSATSLMTTFFSEIVTGAPQESDGNLIWIGKLDSIKQMPAKLRKFEQEAKNDEVARLYVNDFTKAIENEIPFIAENKKERLNKRIAVALVRIEASIGQRMENLLNAVELRNKLSPETLSNIRKLQTQLIFGALFANIAIASLLALFFGSDLSRRVLILADNTERFSKGLPLTSPLPGTDEIAELDKSFHAMATKLREAREKESAFLNNSSNLICSISDEYQLTVVNGTFSTYTEKPVQDLISNSILAFIPEDSQKAFMKDLDAAKNSQKPVQFESNLGLASGKHCDLLWSVKWSPDQKSFFCVTYDISKKKDLERLRKEFVALISHDLRAPITTISGTSSLFLNNAFGSIPEQSRAVLSNVIKQCSQIIELVNDLLDLEKLEARQMNLQLELLDIEAVLKPLIEEKKIQFLKSELSDERMLMLDPERFSFAISAIVNECAEAFESGTFSLLKTQKEERSTCRIMLHFQKAVDDRILEILIEKLTGRQQTDLTSTGSRLKVPLAIRILEAHNCSMQVDLTDYDSMIVAIDVPISARSLATLNHLA